MTECQEAGGGLAEVETAEEQAALEEHVRSEARLGGRDHWIGRFEHRWPSRASSRQCPTKVIF